MRNNFISDYVGLELINLKEYLLTLTYLEQIEMSLVHVRAFAGFR